MTVPTTTGTINLAVTSQKLTDLIGKGASLYTVAFDGTTAYWTTIFSAAPGTTSVPATIPLINSGKLYIIESNATLDQIQSVITTQSNIDVANATKSAHQFRFDSFEYALSPGDEGGTPQGNLTSVVGFGFPMELRVDYTNGTPSMTAGYDISANALTTSLQSIGSPLIQFNSGELKGSFLYAGSPSTPSQGSYVQPVVFTDTHWTTYLQQLGMELANNSVRIAGAFNGAADAANIWHNQGFYSYTISYDAVSSQFILRPEESSQIKGTIKISAANLAKNIYAIDATTKADIYSVVDGVETLYKSEFLGANDQWGAIFTQFLTGLDLGYLGQSGVSPNPLADATNLNVNWNWSPIYAFGENLVGGGAVTPTFDAYSKVFFDNTNSYGSQYSDNAMSQYQVGGPLLNLFQTEGTLNKTVNADQITLTIFADSEAPTGYVKPLLFDYIASPSGGYSIFPELTNPTFVNFVLNLGLPAGKPKPDSDQEDGKNRLSETSWFADPSKLAISYEYLKDTNVWSKASYVFAPAGKPNDLWSQWTLPTEGGDASFTVGPKPGTQGTGSVLLNNIPISNTEGAVAWHKLSVYDKTQPNWQIAPLKVFNLYTTSDGKGGFNFSEGQLAVDGGAKFTTGTQASGPTATVNFLVGSSTFIDPVLLDAAAKLGVDYATSGTIPAAPVVGYLDTSGDFVAQPNQLTMLSPSTKANANNVAFGWTGLNPQSTADEANLWTKFYTNKVSAQHTAKVTWSLASGKDHGTAGSVDAIADIDGVWLTSQNQLTPGLYTVTMTEYRSVAGQEVQFAQKSSALTLSIDGSLDTILAMRDAYIVGPGTSLSIPTAQSTLINDTGSPTSAVLASGPSNGTLSFNTDGSFNYTPDAGFVGLDSFQYMAQIDLGGGSIEQSKSSVNLQVLPDIGKLALSLSDYSTVGLATYGYFNHGIVQQESNAYLALLQQYQDEGLSAESALYNLSNVLGETSAARSIFPFLSDPTTDVQSINSFLDTAYSVLFDRAPDEAGRAYWTNDIQQAIRDKVDIDPYIFIIMNGAKPVDMEMLSAKSLIANEQIFQQYQHHASISNSVSAQFLGETSTSNLLTTMATVYNDFV